MTRHEQLISLITYFLQEPTGASEYLKTQFPYFYKNLENDTSDDELFQLFRALVNVRPPRILPEDIEAIQNTFLAAEILKAGIMNINTLKGTLVNPDMASSQELFLWQGDITTLKVDAIVNAGNSALLGCFYPCHKCIDNVIHTYAGVQLRLACSKIIEAQGHEEKTGFAKITPAFNLPSKFVLHTVGPIIINNRVSPQDEELLASCYASCLNLAETSGCTSIAFCCISTGEFHFPNQKAAEIALGTVKSWCHDKKDSKIRKIVFNVFKDKDYEIYFESFVNLSKN